MVHLKDKYVLIVEVLGAMEITTALWKRRIATLPGHRLIGNSFDLVGKASRAP